MWRDDEDLVDDLDARFNVHDDEFTHQAPRGQHRTRDRRQGAKDLFRKALRDERRSQRVAKSQLPESQYESADETKDYEFLTDEETLKGGNLTYVYRFEPILSGEPGGVGQDQVDGSTLLYLLDRTHFILSQSTFDEDGKRSDVPGATSGKVTAYVEYPSLSPDGAVWGEPEKIRFPPSVVPMLPPKDVDWSFESCAVVGNSGVMLGSAKGEEIDAHSTVFRINYAPIRGYETDVGSKVTFDVCNRPNLMRVATKSTLRDGVNMSLVVHESASWRPYFYIYRQLLQKFPPMYTVVLAPDLALHAERLWRQLAQKFGSLATSCKAITRGFEGNSARCRNPKVKCDTTVCKPNTGWFALVMAAQVCNSVHMYGFESYHYSARAPNVTRYHYFDRATGQTNVHNFDLTMKVFQYLAGRYPIHLR